VSSVFGTVLDSVRMLSDAGVRFLAQKTLAVPGLARERVQEEIEGRWADVEREVADIVRKRNLARPVEPPPASHIDATPQPASAVVSSPYRGGWGPMP